MAVRSIEALDAPWFTRLFGESVDVVRAQPVAEQGRAARTYRVWLDSQVSAVPPSVIVKLSLEHEGYLQRRLALGTYRLEVDVYRLLAPRLAPLLPVCHAAEADDASGRFLIVMEDLAPAAGPGVDLASALLTCAEGLARVHARFWGDCAAVAEVTRRCVLPGMLDQRHIGPTELQITKDLLARKLASHPLPEVVVAAVEAEIRNHARLAEHLRARPLSLCHGDAHLPQFLFPTSEGGRFAIIDWQTPQLASAASDLRSLLMTSDLTIEQRRALQPRLLDRYHQVLLDEGVVGYARSVLEHDHRLTLHQRLMMMLSLPHGQSPADLELWRRRFLEPLLEPLEDDDYVGLVESL
jgi:hypothetical protein